MKPASLADDNLLACTWGSATSWGPCTVRSSTREFPSSKWWPSLVTAWSLPLPGHKKKYLKHWQWRKLGSGLHLQAICYSKLTGTTGKGTGTRGCILHSSDRYVSILYWGFWSSRTPFLGTAQAAWGAWDICTTFTFPEQKPTSQRHKEDMRGFREAFVLEGVR